MPRLSKSTFLKGRQCPRRIWLAAHRPPEPMVEPDDIWEMREVEGAAVERLAESLFNRANRIAPAPDEEEGGEARPDSAELAAKTTEALSQCRPIIQAHLRTDELLAIIDILEPRESGWYVWEVKASTELKPIFDWDLAFQSEVARRCGLQVHGAGVIRLNGEYVRGRELDVGQLLVREDRSDVVTGLAAQVRDIITQLLGVLAEDDAPDATPGSYCKGNPNAAAGDRPSSCGQLGPEGFCGKALPKHWAGRLPRISGAKAAAIAQMFNPTVEGLDPNDTAMKWTDDQRRMIEAVRSGRPQVDPFALKAKLDELVWPVAYIDFEFDTGMAVPRFEGTWPYARIPFQWAMVIQRAPGGPIERPEPFLHLGQDDPRGPFFESLVRALPDSGSVVVHSRAAEETVLKQLGDSLGEPHKSRAAQIIARVFDTVDLARAGYYHPDQQGSYSIKKLAPALLGRGYADLDIQDGMTAVVAWKAATDPKSPPEARERLRGHLLSYCGRDAELMHEIVVALASIAHT